MLPDLFAKAPNTHEYSLDRHAASSPINFLPEAERSQVYGRLARTDEPTRYSIKSPRLFHFQSEPIVLNICDI